MIPFVDLRAQYLSIKGEIDQAIQGVFETAQFVLGDEVAGLEQEFAAYCGVRHAVAVNSGTSALHLALVTAGIGPGDEVLTVPFTFVATVAAICYTGARPRFVDIDPRHYTMDPSRIDAAITEHTRAILPVHLYGQSGDLTPILDIARRRGLLVIEDAAQAHGAEYRGVRVGAMGDLACFSFYPAKNLGACGEGGMLLTSNARYAERARMLRNWGEARRYEHVLRGYNYRMDGIQGAILRVKLRHLEEWIAARRARAALYDRLFSNSDVEPPVVMPGNRHVYHIYAIRSRHRDALRERLHELDIQTGIHYPVPVHLQTAYADLGYHPGDFPHAERAAAEVLSLPIYPELSESQLGTVARSVRETVHVQPA